MRASSSFCLKKFAQGFAWSARTSGSPRKRELSSDSFGYSVRFAYVSRVRALLVPLRRDQVARGRPAERFYREVEHHEAEVRADFQVVLQLLALAL